MGIFKAIDQWFDIPIPEGIRRRLVTPHLVKWVRFQTDSPRLRPCAFGHGILGFSELHCPGDCEMVKALEALNLRLGKRKRWGRITSRESLVRDIFALRVLAEASPEERKGARLEYMATKGKKLPQAAAHARARYGGGRVPRWKRWEYYALLGYKHYGDLR